MEAEKRYIGYRTDEEALEMIKHIKKAWDSMQMSNAQVREEGTTFLSFAALGTDSLNNNIINGLRQALKGVDA